MSEANQYANLREQFLKVCKRVCKENLTRNRDKHREYLNDLVTSYNKIIRYVHSFYESLDTETRASFRTDWIYYRDKVQAVYGKLNVTLELPRDLFVLLSIEPILENYNRNAEPQVESEAAPEFRQTSSQLTVTVTPPVSGKKSNSCPNSPKKDNRTFERPKSASPKLNNSEYFENFKMAATTEEKIAFIKSASQMINKSYGGDPLSLASFINSVKLLKSVTAANLNGTLLEFVKSRLEGKALECIPRDPANVDAIIEALERDIQPDNSKVVAGRLLALRADRSKLTEFTAQAENLADALQRSLIIEGISQAKAREMCIEKTVEVCRNATRSDLVKAVLASTKFDSPKDVVAKYVVEASTEEKEKQVLAYRAYQGQNKRNNRNNGGNRNRNGNFRGRNGNFRGRNGNNGRNNFGNNNNYGNDGQNGNRNYNDRGNRGRNNYNGYNNSGGYRNNNNRNGDNRGIRYAENYDAPQVSLGGAQNNNN